MNPAVSPQSADSANLPINKKAKAVQKRLATENTVEAIQQKRSAAIYLRVSSEMQVDGFSIEAQKIACLKYAREQGYEVTDSHIYIDEAYSAKNEERPNFKRMIMAAHAAEFAMIIIHKMDRFERNFKAMRNTLEDLANIGVHVFSISENMELANTLTVNLFGIINEHYIQNLSWETAKGKHQAAKEGYFIGSKVPFGYRKWKIGDSPELDCRILIKDEKEADALQKCFEMYASGNYSFEDLASFLNDQGFVSRSGQAFREDTMRGMLENPIYIGYVEYQGVKKDTYLTYIGKHVPLVSVELFNKVAAVREIRAEGKSRTKYDADVLKSHYMVQNLLCCESCRRRVRVRTADGKYTYRDYSEERGLVCKDSGKKISAIYLDKLVSDFIASIVLPRNWIDSVGAHANESDTINEIKKQIAKVKSRMERRYEAYTVSGTQQLFEKFERDQKADQNLLEELAQKLPKESAVVNTQITLTRSLIDLFKIATKQEQYDIVHYLFANLYVDFDNYCLTAFEPKAEFDFLFSTFAPLNGWKKEGARYLLPCHYHLPDEENQDDKDKQKGSENPNKKISRKQLAAMHGFFLNSKAPFGYKKSDLCDPVYPDSRILIIDEPAASAVRKCYELYSNGDNSYSDLAEMLNKQGFISTSGGSFNRETIRLMLSNPAYRGDIVYQNTEIYEGKHEAIVPRELWNEVQKIRNRRRI